MSASSSDAVVGLGREAEEVVVLAGVVSVGTAAGTEEVVTAAEVADAASLVLVDSAVEVASEVVDALLPALLVTAAATACVVAGAADF